MKKRVQRRWVSCLVLLLLWGTLAPAWGGPLKVLLPRSGDLVGGENILCVAEFKSARPITRVDFLVDDQPLTALRYRPPVQQATATFIWDAREVSEGVHRLAVKAYSGNILVGSDGITVTVSNTGNDIVPPQVHIAFPRPDSVVSGITEVGIQATDNRGVAMVTLFIDKQLKLLQNFPPYRYQWDTTLYPNGPHEIEVWAYDAAQNKGEARPVRVFVNNPAGRTEIKEIPEELPSQKLTVLQPPRETPRLQRGKGQSFSSPSVSAPSSGKKETAKTPNQHSTLPSDQESRRKEATTLRPRVGVHQVEGKPIPPSEPRSHRSIVGLKPEAKPISPPQLLQARPTERELPPLQASQGEEKVSPSSSPLQQGRSVTSPIRPKEKTPSSVSQKPVSSTTTEAREKRASGGLAERTLKGTLPLSEGGPKGRALVARLPRREGPRKPVWEEGPYRLGMASPFPASGLRISLNDQPLDLDVAPWIRKGITMVPFRQVFEHCGGVVLWIPGERLVRAYRPGTQVELRIGSRWSLLNGEKVRMDQPALIKEGRTIVALRFVATALNLHILYDPERHLVRLFQP